jgi:signal transduction histidine kinase
MRPTIRLRMTLLYAVVFFVAGALLLSVSYALVRTNLTGSAGLRGLSPDDYALHEAIQREVADDALGKLRTQYAVALAALTGLSVLLGWAVAGRVLRPLQQITATAQRVSQDNLDERIGLEGPRDELKELADTFDGMLERLSGAFASQRRFVANASHELRTPLTVMRTELEVTLDDPRASSAELRDMAEAVRDHLARAERLIEALLTLARSDATPLGREVVDLAEAARIALHHAEPERVAAGLAVHGELERAPVRGNRRLLERLVANLVENAVRHNRTGGALTVRTATTTETATVVVENDGDALPDEALPTLLEPFQRLGREARGEGAGLGLSIVRAVAAGHGGTVGLTARPQGGLRATVQLPAARADALRPTPDPIGAHV